MKKVLILIGLICTLTGCQNIEKNNYDEIVNLNITNNIKTYNIYRTGYKYFLPSGARVDYINEYNEVLSTKNTNYYLFIDMISYYNKIDLVFTENENAYFSYVFENGNDKGYIEINKKEDNFIVEMIYNYAKIELSTYEYSLKEDILRSMTIITSVKFNDTIVENIMGENILEFKEFTYNIAKANKDTSDFIKSREEYEVYDGEDTEIPDYDVIN